MFSGGAVTRTVRPELERSRHRFAIGCKARMNPTTTVEEVFDLVQPAAVVVPADEAELATSAHRLILWRTKWGTYSESAALKWATHPLQNAEATSVPTEPGVYSLLVQPGIAGHPAASFLMYIGRANNLRRRFKEYLTSERSLQGRPKVSRRLRRYSDYVWFCCAALPGMPSADLARVEDRLIVAYTPAWNDQFPAEVRGVIKGVLG